MPLTDVNASAVDTAALEGQISLAESGALDDVPSLEVALVIVDAGDGTDIVTTESVYLVTVSDTGGLVDEVWTASLAITISDTATGDDAVADLSASFTIAESGSRMGSTVKS